MTERSEPSAPLSRHVLGLPRSCKATRVWLSTISFRRQLVDVSCKCAKSRVQRAGPSPFFSRFEGKPMCPMRTPLDGLLGAAWSFAVCCPGREVGR